MSLVVETFVSTIFFNLSETTDLDVLLLRGLSASSVPFVCFDMFRGSARVSKTYALVQYCIFAKVFCLYVHARSVGEFTILDVAFVYGLATFCLLAKYEETK